MKEEWRTQNHYELLGVLVDFTADELRKSYRKMSVKYHPDKRKDKSNEAFQAVAAAYEILQDDTKRMDYDFGKEFDPPEDSNRYPYREDILRHYFPERFKFEPFGDPHLNDYTLLVNFPCFFSNSFLFLIRSSFLFAARSLKPFLDSLKCSSSCFFFNSSLATAICSRTFFGL